MGRIGPGRGRKEEGQPENSGGFRIPAVLMVPAGLSVGWVVANWPGAIFGCVIGIFLWRSRA